MGRVRKRILELVDAIKRDGIVLVPTKGEGAVDTAALAAAAQLSASSTAASAPPTTGRAALEPAAVAAAAAAEAAAAEGPPRGLLNTLYAPKNQRDGVSTLTRIEAAVAPPPSKIAADKEMLQAAQPKVSKPPFALLPGTALPTKQTTSTAPITTSPIKTPGTATPRSPRSPRSSRSPRSPREGDSPTTHSPPTRATQRGSTRHRRLIGTSRASSRGGFSSLATPLGLGLGMSRGGVLGDSEPLEARLLELCHEFDVDRAGVVSAAEFLHALALCVGAPLPDAQARELLTKLPLDDEGYFTYGELPLLIDLLPAELLPLWRLSAPPDSSPNPPATDMLPPAVAPEPDAKATEPPSLRVLEPALIPVLPAFPKEAKKCDREKACS